MNHKASNPIGIFDSGIGGLTVARAITHLLPNESIVYFGDTAHLPYGDKSAAAIQSYSVKIADMLLSQECKTILIACNSASASAYELVKEHVGDKAHVMNVIDPVVSLIKQEYGNKRIGLIGTNQTVNSNVYKKKVDALSQDTHVTSLATPLLAPMIEDGFHEGKITESVIHEYLSHPDLSEIDALILGCTHYPMIKNEISSFYKSNTSVIDSSETVAATLKNYLSDNNLLNTTKSVTRHFYVSDLTESFRTSTRLFFDEEINLEHYPLWD